MMGCDPKPHGFQGRGHALVLFADLILVRVFAAAAIADPDVVPEIVKRPTFSTQSHSTRLKQRNCRESQPAAELNPRLRQDVASRDTQEEGHLRQAVHERLGCWCTHMTRTEWQRTRRRMTDERANFIVDQLGSSLPVVPASMWGLSGPCRISP